MIATTMLAPMMMDARMSPMKKAVTINTSMNPNIRFCTRLDMV